MTFAVAFLATPDHPANDNHERLPRIFRDAGWRVTVCHHDNLSMLNESVQLGGEPIEDFDLLWPIGLGPRATFMDRLQLLGLIDRRRLLTAAQNYTSLHGKAAWLKHAPRTVIARHAHTLVESFNNEHGQWIIKPLAGSFGRGVQRVESETDIRHAVDGAPDQYWMLQHYLPDITAGEKRTLICGDQVLGSYLRLPNPNERQEFRANMAKHAQARPTRLTSEEVNLVKDSHATLQADGVGFAAIDTAGGYIIEVNIANPGGLGTMSTLYGPEFKQTANAAIVKAATDLASRHHSPK